MPYKNKADRMANYDYKSYDGTPEEIKKRTARNKARAIMVKAGAVKKGDGKEVDHKKALSKGGTTTKSNLRVKSAADNRSFPRNPDQSMKSNP
jgi:hypothetical protein